MNQRFFLLPEERQQIIINAGYKVFSENSYKRCPVSEIADQAGISKALLFHYFRNKKELYIYLFQNAKEVTSAEMLATGVTKSSDFFDLIQLNARVKCKLIRKYPYMSAFMLKSVHEQEPEIKDFVQQYISGLFDDSNELTMKLLEQSCLDGTYIEDVYNQIIYTMYGYLHTVYMSNKIDPDQIEHDLMHFIEFWKMAYHK